MAEHPFPDDPNAEVCVHTGGRAYAVVGRLDRNRVSGWYGSTLIDGDTMLVVAEGFPEGPICDDVLRQALSDGRIFDPDPLLSGRVQARDLPDAVVAGLLRLGIASGLRMLAHDEPGPVGLPSMIHEGDDWLGQSLMGGFFRRREEGTDLERMGVVIAVVNKARGRAFGRDGQEAAIAVVLDRLREEREFAEELALSLAASEADSEAVPG